MTYVEIWTFRTIGSEPTSGMPDVTGFDVEATDGHIGKIDEETNDLNSGLVVDTGWWIFGKKRIIPAGMIDRIDRDDEKVHLKLTKDQVKDAPDFDASRRHDEDYRKNVGDYYSQQ